MNAIRFSKRVTFSRRRFLQLFAAGILYFLDGGIFSRLSSALENEPTSTGRQKSNTKGDYDLVVASGDSPFTMTVKAIAAMGGMERFVRKNSVVLIKPNMAWDRNPEQAANTNPDVVAALVQLCYGAGARRVNVFDRPCNEARRTYKNSGIQDAAIKHGAQVYYPDEWNSVKAHFNHKSLMEGWPVFRDALECDTFINVPILKHHGLTRLTLSMKNLMGVCCANRGNIHTNIASKLVDLTAFINPDLTVIDAYRVLMRNGPSGGNMSDVLLFKKLIVGTDSTLTDTYACKLLGVNPQEVPYIKEAMDRKFGSADIENATIKEVSA